MASRPSHSRSDPARIAPFLTHLVAHHGQLTLTPPQNAASVRKQKPLDRARSDRRRDHDEPRFNTAAPASPRGPAPRRTNPERTQRPARFSRDTMVPDYPPPTFQEAIMTPPFVPLLPIDEQSAQDNPPPLTLHTHIPPRTPSPPPETATTSDNASSSEDSSIEIVTLDTDSWDQERRLGVPLLNRVERERRRLQAAESSTHLPLSPRPRASPGPLDHDRCSRCGSPKPDHNTDLPASHAFVPAETHSPPASPRLGPPKWKRLFIPAPAHTDALPPTPSSPKSPRFGFLPAAFASTLTLSHPTPSPSPTKPFAHKEGSVVKRLFSHAHKGKAREQDAQPRPEDNLDENWLVVNEQDDDSDAFSIEPASSSSSSDGSDRSVPPADTAPRPTPVDTSPAFINRAVRPPAPFPVFPPNASVVSLPLAPLTAWETFQLRHDQPSPRRKALSTVRPSPSVVWLPLANPTPDEPVLPAPFIPAYYAPPLPMPPAVYARYPGPAACPSPLAFSVLPAEPPHAAGPDSAHLTRTPTLRSQASVSTLAASPGPSTPTTPTRHYHGRPLPQPPGAPLPSAAPTTTTTTTVLPAEHAARTTTPTDLAVLAAHAVDDDHDGNHYEDFLRIADIAGPATTPEVKLPRADRVELRRRRVTKDGRVRVKLVLMDVVVDKCSICLSQFKDAEVACLGACQHAYHEYCLRRWIVRSRACPLCRETI